MAVHKLSAEFGPDRQVEWPCPHCGQMTLQIQEETFESRESRDTREHIREDWFDMNMVDLVFSCIAECSRPQCREVVACSGCGGVDVIPDEDGSDECRTWFRPMNFVPPLCPFEIPANCPDEIKSSLLTAFSLYLVHPGAAANLIRITVEHLLTAMGVPDRTEADRRIPLHNRLQQLPERYAGLSGALMAIKFLGNAGSHSHDRISARDVEQAFEIIDYVLNDLFSGQRESVEILTRRLSERFGHG